MPALENRPMIADGLCTTYVGGFRVTRRGRFWQVYDRQDSPRGYGSLQSGSAGSRAAAVAAGPAYLSGRLPQADACPAQGAFGRNPVPTIRNSREFASSRVTSSDQVRPCAVPSLPF